MISRAVMAWAFRVNYRVAFVMRRDTTGWPLYAGLHARESARKRSRRRNLRIWPMAGVGESNFWISHPAKRRCRASKPRHHHDLSFSEIKGCSLIRNSTARLDESGIPYGSLNGIEPDRTANTSHWASRITCSATLPSKT